MENFDSNQGEGNSRKIIFAIIAIIVLVALAVGGYYLMKKSGGNVPVASVSPTPKVDSILDSDSDTIPDAVEKATEIIFLSEDKKNIIAEGVTLLTIEDNAIFSFFKDKSGLCDEINIDTVDEKTFCENKEIFKSKTRFTSIILSTDKTKIGFTIESDQLSPDKVAGIFYPNRVTDKIYFLTSYYLGNEFISFSPSGINFVYRNGCFEGYCGLYIKNSETLEAKISFSSGDGGIQNFQFVRWISDNEFEYKINSELKKLLF